jgi:hypothetical protein
MGRSETVRWFLQSAILWRVHAAASEQEGTRKNTSMFGFLKTRAARRKGEGAINLTRTPRVPFHARETKTLEKIAAGTRKYFTG